MEPPTYFILTGESPDRARSTFQINNSELSVEITSVDTVRESDIPYKGSGDIAFGVYYRNGKGAGVCLGRIYGSGVCKGKQYIVVHPHSEPTDKGILAQYVERRGLNLDGVTTLEELKASLEVA